MKHEKVPFLVTLFMAGLVQLSFAIPAGGLLGYLMETLCHTFQVYSVEESFWFQWTAILAVVIWVGFMWVASKWKKTD